MRTILSFIPALSDQVSVHRATFAASTLLQHERPNREGHKSLNVGRRQLRPKNPANPPLPGEGHSAPKTRHGINFVTLGSRNIGPRHRESV